MLHAVDDRTDQERLGEREERAGDAEGDDPDGAAALLEEVGEQLPERRPGPRGSSPRVEDLRRPGFAVSSATTFSLRSGA
ncbi:hypothetical protein [Leucobacter soli]|uniref:hypothetical protein n=1 Tax=Leucobacter soli TaxID=2812850 RepID=UPI003618CD35